MGGETKRYNWIRWTDEKDRKLLSMQQRNLSMRQMGHLLGVSGAAVCRRLKLLASEQALIEALEQADKEPAPPPSSIFEQQTTHMRKLRAQRRGFDVPPELEGRYFDLLKSGKSIDQARRSLGLKPRAQEA